jgi:hypothetical protein
LSYKGEKPTTYRSVARTRPCPVCSGHDGCSVGADGSIQCRRVPDGLRPGQQHNGHVLLHISDKDPQWGTYREVNDPRLLERERDRREEWERGQRCRRASGNSTAHVAKDDKAAPPEMEAVARRHAENLTEALARELADALGLRVDVLARLHLLGYSPRGFHEGYMDQPCWTMPECNPAGQITGLVCRYPDGKKKALAGSGRSLALLRDWDTGHGPVFAVEGHTDNMALAALNLSVVGRPSNKGGVDHLAELLKDVPAGRDIIIVGEWDPKADGTWPGRDGAVSTAARLAALLHRPVKWALPPNGAKDVRVWVNSQNLPPDCLDAWHEAGSRLSDALVEKANDVKPTAAAAPPTAGPDRLATTSLADIRPEPIHWLVPGYLPLGKLVLIAGDGGHGKSTITLSLAADLSRGRPCLGLDYEPPAAAEVLLVGCEDDYGDTVVPRLLAAGADLGRVFKVDGVRGADGRVLPFSLAHYQAMERELEARPDVRFVVIDPAGAFIGRTGVDDHKDSELRSLLDPMAELAARRCVTIILVKHLNKNASPKAIHKVNGSTGYVNAVRAAFVVAPSLEDESIKLILPLKFNLAKKPAGLSYCLDSLDAAAAGPLLAPFGHLGDEDRERLAEQLFRVRWLGPVTTDADSLFAQAARNARGANKVVQCAEWLEAFLGDHAFPSDEIVEAAKREGFTFDNVKEAKAKLKEKGLRNSNQGRFQGEWWSGFGDPLSWTLRPHTARTPNTPESPHSPHTGEWEDVPPPHILHSPYLHTGESRERVESGECGGAGSLLDGVCGVGVS